MDLILNKMVLPKSSRDCFIIQPIAKTWITGIAKAYSFEYDHKILGEYMTESEFTAMMARINDALVRIWPCDLSILIGYMLCPITCGLSFLIPYMCISDAEKALDEQVKYFNEYRLKQQGLHLTFVKRYSYSWFELRVLSYDDTEMVQSSKRSEDEETGLFSKVNKS